MVSGPDNQQQAVPSPRTAKPREDDVETTQTNQTSLRELDSRVNDGIEVKLLWSTIDGSLSVSVSDTRTGQTFSVDVPDKTRSLDVFHHPYAYAPASVSKARAL